MGAMPPPAFRTATEADIADLVELVTSAYRGEASRAGWTTEADLLDGARIDALTLRTDMRRPRSRVVVAPDEAGLAACALVADEGDAAYFGMFAVRPALQRGGLGSRLLAECERVAREEWALQLMRMTVIDLREPLIAWYGRRGYRRTGIHKPFPYGDERFGVPLRDDLRFEVLEKRLDGPA
jgi:ribosomal protein S18 acetylase RimI-like enzyme